MRQKPCPQMELDTKLNYKIVIVNQLLIKHRLEVCAATAHDHPISFLQSILIYALYTLILFS